MQWNKIGTCEGLHVIVYDGGTHRHACAYQGAGAAPLVAAATSDDVPTFCNGTSWDIVGGSVPASCNLAGYYYQTTLANMQQVCPLECRR
jgi:hypothetical protein